MGHDPLFHALLLLEGLWFCAILRWVWPRRRAAMDQADGQPATRTDRCSADPPPFPGLTTKPLCATCEQAAQAHVAQASAGPPPLMTSARGRRRQVATQHQFCPHPCCRYYGWVGRGNLRANGHPGGGPWRQLACVVCGAYFLETHGTPLRGKRVPSERPGRVVAALAEGLGIRAVARVFEVDPNTVLAWLEVHDPRLSQPWGLPALFYSKTRPRLPTWLFLSHIDIGVSWAHTKGWVHRVCRDRTCLTCPGGVFQHPAGCFPAPWFLPFVYPLVGICQSSLPFFQTPSIL
jgi:transposase-like protein